MDIIRRYAQQIRNKRTKMKSFINNNNEDARSNRQQRQLQMYNVRIYNDVRWT